MRVFKRHENVSKTITKIQKSLYEKLQSKLKRKEKPVERPMIPKVNSKSSTISVVVSRKDLKEDVRSLNSFASPFSKIDRIKPRAIFSAGNPRRMLINHSIKQVAPRLERNVDLRSPSKETDLWSQIRNFKIDRNKIMSQGGKREKTRQIPATSHIMRRRRLRVFSR